MPCGATDTNGKITEKGQQKRYFYSKCTFSLNAYLTDNLVLNTVNN